MDFYLYMSFNVSSIYPRATDNSGYVSIVVPDDNELYPNQVVTTPSPIFYLFNWTAVDGANNTATCTTRVEMQGKLTSHLAWQAGPELLNKIHVKYYVSQQRIF